MKVAKILVVGQVPPPYHGQAISTKRFLEGSYKNAELVHLNLSFSSTLDEVGKFRAKKIFILLKTIAKIFIYRFKFGCDVLYYMPCGGQRVALYRDVLILLSTRWLFNKTIYHFRSAGLSLAYEKLTLLEKMLVKLAFGKPTISIRLSDLNPPDGKFLNSKRDVIIPNGMEDHYMDYGKKESNSSTVNILYIGSIRPSKGINELMKAIEKLSDSNLDFKLNLAGKFHDQTYENKVLEFAKLHSGYVNYLGEISGDKKWSTFAETDILVFPTFYENESFGLVTIEAMQFKIPVIATDWRAIPGIVEHEKSGLIVPIKDHDALADSIKHLIKDEQLRIQMGELGRKVYLQKFSVDSFYSNFDKLFSSLN